MKLVRKSTCTVRNMDALSLFRTMESGSVDLICTDPPYRITSRGSTGTMGGMLKDELSRKGKIFKFNDIHIRDWISEAYRVLKDDTHFYVMTNNTNLLSFLDCIRVSSFDFVKCLIWEKTNKIAGRFYMDCFEYIIMCRKGKQRCINEPSTPSLLKVPLKKYKVNGVIQHPTEKPIKLMEILIRNSSNKGDLVCDPFVGIGTTALASKKLRRNFIGCDIDMNYYKIAEKRLRES